MGDPCPGGGNAELRAHLVIPSAVEVATDIEGLGGIETVARIETHGGERTCSQIDLTLGLRG